MPFTLEMPDYKEALARAWANIAMPFPPNFADEVAKNLDRFGTYSFTLCCLWRDTASVCSLKDAPFLINQFPVDSDSRVYTMGDVATYRKEHKEYYDDIDRMPKAIKGLTSLQAAAVDFMLEVVTGTRQQVPPINALGVRNDIAMLPFLCRKAVSHEFVSDYQKLMEGGNPSE